MNTALTPANYDGVVSALTGNGELCTTLGPTGYHVSPDQWTDTAHQTQSFVMAGRRRTGPQRPLIDFGAIHRTLTVNGESLAPDDWKQTIDWATGAVLSEWRNPNLEERTRSFVALSDNAFLADTVLTNTGDSPLDVAFRVIYRFGEGDADLPSRDLDRAVSFSYELEQHLGDIRFSAADPLASGDLKVSAIDRGAAAGLGVRLNPGESAALSVLLHFSDRIRFEFPLTVDDADAVAERHEAAWRAFWNRSEVVTGNETVDAFRRSSLYTLRCQATPWSIPPTVSEPYWGAGTFHDEMYPFFGLLSANHADLAERIPYFRLTTLPQAQARARGRGALYPWSSTEQGEERDPNGLWLTERFHLGQFAVCIYTLWLYQRDRIQLADLYPVLRDLARYFELNMLETDEAGRLRTRSCVDFDESVDAVTNGPFTISAAIATMEHAAGAAELLGVDAERIPRWRSLAGELRRNLPLEGERYTVPDGKPLHYSILGPAFPFRVDVGSERARVTARHIHETFRSMHGWQPGHSEGFGGSSWMWMAGHLAAVHAMQGNAELAWEAVRGGPLSAGPFLSPNEHVDAGDTIHVPWFTTGCGGWLYGLHALFVQVDEAGTILLPAIPAAIPNARFRGLRAHGGVLVSGTFESGKLVTLTGRSPVDQEWTYRIPARWIGAEANSLAATTVKLRAGEDIAVLPS